eukprot:NODE_1403_length_1429_cov_185.150725_g1168_i0.p1 GENE.NODE_1403_length_1429_cov_185.150725_g1168_i0~~NODE_1403_length_1429_cov_185.150725_g1168_i0.p1  ORF type:complete len:379 (+),score=163.45 NODE_1403_length_1429_cov_185.150725_g1168_i0:111-1247(+)
MIVATLLALGMATAIAAEGFSVEINRRPVKYAHRARIHTDYRASILKGEVPPLPVRDFENEEYIANVSLGTPPQTFSLVMDTGSANLWVSDSSCSDQGCSNMHKFYSKRSATFQSTTTPFNLQYGTGSCSGDFAYDNLGMTAKSGPFVKKQEFGLATTVAAFFSSTFDVDGIFGLGLTSMAVGTVPTPVDNLVSQGIMSKKLFAVALASDNSTASTIDFGFTDPKKHSGALKYVPISKTLGLEYLYYMIDFSGMKIGSDAVSGCLLGLICQGVVDTGTSYLVGPTTVINPIISKIGMKTDCSNYATLPDFTITVSGVDLVITKETYVIKDGNQCVLAMQGVSPLEVQFWIFGDPFLRAFYSVFDIDQMRLGFAPLAKH